MINKVILIGHLGRDPDSRYSANGMHVCNFSIATTEKHKNKTTGEYEKYAEWHNIVCFDNLASIAKNYLKKGSKVYIEGSIKTDKYTDKQGVARTKTTIIANTIQMLDSKSSTQESEDLTLVTETKTNDIKELFPDNDSLPF
jgi:single-strand DNA-binding protein